LQCVPLLCRLGGMNRSALRDLKDRFSKTSTPKPLVLRGARQVGKSFLIRTFAKESGLDLVEINFEKTQLVEIGNSRDFSIDKVITEIEIFTRKKVSDKSLIFLDEIQAQPEALNALRYFYEDRPGLKVVAAGSLLEVAMHKLNFRMPVGRVDYYYLGPMTFSEFLMALGEDLLLEQILSIELNKPPLRAIHDRAIEALRKYYLIGGMPEAVDTYITTKDFEMVRDCQISLINTYKDDIPKYSQGKQREIVLSVFNYTPFNIGKKVVFSDISESHSSQVKDAIANLARANIIYPTFHNNASGLPLKAGEVSSVMKLYFTDVGLYNAMLGLEWKDLYALPPDELITRGHMAEQFTAQHLLFRTPGKELLTLYYWQRNAKKGTAEIDFIISEAGKIYPIEVKSGSTGKMRSLWQFVAEKRRKTAVRLDLSYRHKLLSSVSHKVTTAKGETVVECDLIGIPLYAIEVLGKILS
jgi:uncharacterized protein